MTVRAVLGNLARQASPRHRRWDRLVRGLDLDPDALPRPVQAPGPRDVLVCGSPRTGTALLAAMLWQPPAALCVMEPWDSMRLAPAELFASLRAEIATGTLARGRLDVASLVAGGDVRWCRDGERPVAVDVDPDVLLAVKLPAFWRYLDLLPVTRFVVCLRSPVEVIASYKHTSGRLRAGLEYDTAFNRALNDELVAATDDEAVRRVLLYDRINARILPHLERPNVHVVRYEQWFTDPGDVLARLGHFLGVRLDRPLARVAPQGSPSLPPDELALVRRLCTTACPLGYDV